MALFFKKKDPMNTTDNTYPAAEAPKKDELAKDDIKALKREYNKGVSIDSLATQYGYSSEQVSSAVVEDVTVEPTGPTQAELDAQPDKKAK